MEHIALTWFFLGFMVGLVLASAVGLWAVLRIAKEKAALREELAKEKGRSEFRDLLMGELEHKFKLLASSAAETLESRASQRMSDVAQRVSEELRSLRGTLERLHSSQMESAGRLIGQVEQLSKLSKQLSQEAERLTRALEGDVRVRGSWGEVVLERVLELAGLREGIEYRKQPVFRTPDGAVLRPDVEVLLPEGRRVLIDAKVALEAWERLVSATDAQEKERHLKEHVEAVKGHLRRLASKSYALYGGEETAPVVLMFVPIEGALSAALDSFPELASEAARSGVAMVTPQTLLMTLRLVKEIWNVARQSEEAARIVSRAEALHDKLVGFLDSFALVGKRLQDAIAAWREAGQRLSEGRGNVIRQLELLKELGIGKKKPKLKLDLQDRG